jgi:hypothetical protein
MKMLKTEMADGKVCHPSLVRNSCFLRRQDTHPHIPYYTCYFPPIRYLSDSFHTHIPLSIFGGASTSAVGTRASSKSWVCYRGSGGDFATSSMLLVEEMPTKRVSHQSRGVLAPVKLEGAETAVLRGAHFAPQRQHSAVPHPVP